MFNNEGKMEMKELWRDWLPQVVIVFASAAAGGFWVWSSLVGIRNNQDTFIADLQRASELSAYAAIAASVAAFAGAYRFNRKWEITDSIWKWFSTWFK